MNKTGQGAERFWNKKTVGLIPYVPGEQPREKNLIKLNTNENPYGPARQVEEVLRDYAVDRLRLYPDPACSNLRQAIADNYGLDRAQVFVGNGSDEVLALAFQAFFEAARTGLADPAQALTFPDITYSFYPVYARFYELNWRTIALNADFTLPLAEFALPSAGIILANPNAPTGLAISLASIRQLAEADRNRLIIVDEAYVDFGAESAVCLLDDFDNILVIKTCSKARSLAGLRLGYALGPPALITALERVRDSFNSYTVDSLAQLAGEAAFAADDWFRQTRASIIQSREELTAGLEKRAFQVLPSKANFVFARHAEKKGIDLYTQLRAGGVLVRHFNQARISDFLRITVGTPDQIEATLSLLDQILV